jgi:formate dehydrogenase subunit beta
MADKYKLGARNGDENAALRELLKDVLAQPEISAVVAPLGGAGDAVMPALVSDPDRLDDARPLSPSFPVNAARLMSRLTRKPARGRIAALLRPCEIRAFVELVKLNQADRAQAVIIGFDCPGAMTNRDYATWAASGDAAESTRQFVAQALSAPGEMDDRMAQACSVCEHPLPMSADIAVELFGRAGSDILLTGRTDAGRALLEDLEVVEKTAETASSREEIVSGLIERRTEKRDELFQEVSGRINDLGKLSEYLASCVNCYNCRVACPVCYCRECVFTTDVFDHDPDQYLNWAERRGAVRLPADTAFYHITRLVHMSHACVGCGQCANACPNDIPLAALFRAVAHKTQEAFEYEPGRDADQPPPLAVFHEDELSEVVG